MFFDTAAMSNCTAPTPYITLTAYLLATDVSEPAGLSAWECSLVTNPPMLPAQPVVTVESGGTNTLTPTDY
jgi:hypothetical protein